MDDGIIFPGQCQSKGMKGKGKVFSLVYVYILNEVLSPHFGKRQSTLMSATSLPCQSY